MNKNFSKSLISGFLTLSLVGNCGHIIPSPAGFPYRPKKIGKGHKIGFMPKT